MLRYPRGLANAIAVKVDDRGERAGARRGRRGRRSAAPRRLRCARSTGAGADTWVWCSARRGAQSDAPLCGGRRRARSTFRRAVRQSGARPWPARRPPSPKPGPARGAVCRTSRFSPSACTRSAGSSAAARRSPARTGAPARSAGCRSTRSSARTTESRLRSRPKSRPPASCGRMIWRIKAGDRSRVQDAVKDDLSAITVDHVLDGRARAGRRVDLGRAGHREVPRHGRGQPRRRRRPGEARARRHHGDRPPICCSSRSGSSSAGACPRR